MKFKGIKLDSMSPSDFVKLFAVAAIYLAAAKLGLSLAFATEQVSTIWPATGVALAVVLIGGYRYLPAIFLGALVANSLTHEPLLVALAIAIGNTLEAAAGAYLLKRVLNFNNSFDRIIDVLGFVALAGLLSTIISATIGTLSLGLGGLIDWKNFTSVWSNWWAGDVMGNLIFAPFLLFFSRPTSFKALRQRPVEAVLLTTLLLTVSILVFFFQQFSATLLRSYMLFPFIMWIALRFTQPGVVIGTLIIAATSLLATLSAKGPFSGNISVEQNLILLQIFIFIISVTAMFLAVTVAERNRTEHALRERTAQLKESNDRITNILGGILQKEDAVRTPSKEE